MGDGVGDFVSGVGNFGSDFGNGAGAETWTSGGVVFGTEVAAGVFVADSGTSLGVVLMAGEAGAEGEAGPGFVSCGTGEAAVGGGTASRGPQPVKPKMSPARSSRAEGVARGSG